MRICYLKKLPVVVLFLVVFVSCKKESADPGAGSDYFSFKIGTKVYNTNTLKFSKLNIEGNIACVHFFEAKSKDNKYQVRFTCNNQRDTVSTGNYIITNPPPGTSDLRNKISDFQITISNSLDSNNAVYYQAESDFTVTISSLAGNRISGTFTGKMTGGIPTPGGFGGSAYTNVRTVEVKEGKFDTVFY